MTRIFEDKPAVRQHVPILAGFIGPSGGGKTYSALRFATGVQRVSGGDIYVIDTEARRALHYADKFKFRHLPFSAPFSPDDYLAAVRHCVDKGAKTIIIDSMSHEHEGSGGVLEWHQREVERLMAAWRCTEDKANIPAWGKPKAARRAMINAFLQMDINLLFCFRAKDKIKIGGGKVTQMGFMPIAGEELVFEMLFSALLLPNANGVPTWQSNEIGEKMMIKLPEQFRELFRNGAQLNEDMGEQVAKWAAGTSTPVSSDAKYNVGGLEDEYQMCSDIDTINELEARRKEIWKQLSPVAKQALKSASDAARARLTTPSVEGPTDNHAQTESELL